VPNGWSCSHTAGAVDEIAQRDDDVGVPWAHTGFMINVNEISKSYGQHLAVDALTFQVRPGVVTGFLGPNGAGKSTTMRMILGLDRPTSGSATVNGRQLADHRAPLAEIGALLEAQAVHRRRSARNHLLALAATNGIPTARVSEVLALVGLESVADRSSGGFSLGMGQRLGIASALLADPQVVMLDEPVNGLDPEGILWIRELLKDLASQGRTVFVSSHLMSEMALIAEQFVIIGQGRLIADVTTKELESMATARSVHVRTSEAATLRDLLVACGVEIASSEPGTLSITGLTSDDIGKVAANAGIALYELTPRQPSLEEIFMELTHDSVQYRAGTTEGVAA
jgi:ABC-2 type transport system ATP-binding protein